MPKIKFIQAQELLDSRGNPTIQARVELSSGVAGKALVPSGASTGKHEAHELRDGGKRYHGQGVAKAIANINEKINRKLYGIEVTEQEHIDQAMIELDGTEHKKELGANAILAVSLACARAAAAQEELPLYTYLAQQFAYQTASYTLPRPMMNVLNGGRHADNGLSVQEFMIVPNHKEFSEMVRMGVEVYHTLHTLLVDKKMSTGLGDEGGFAPQIESNTKALDVLQEAVTKAGYKPGRHIDFALDVAASEFYSNKKYTFEGKRVTAEQLSHMYQEWNENYPLISIEDGFAEDDWPAWRMQTNSLDESDMMVGDDLFVTNLKRLTKGIHLHVANTILIKPNQIGTLSETMEVIKLAQERGYAIIISHRSGETCDTFIADLAVAVGAPFIKAGAPARGERVAKYNRLLEIYHEIV